MATSFYDRVKMGVTAAPGTGAITLGAAAPGFRSFAAAAVANGAIVSYVIEDGANWEIGHGTYTAAGTSLARTSIIASSAAGAGINVGASASVFLTVLAEDLATISTGGSDSGGDTNTGPPLPSIVQSVGWQGASSGAGAFTLPAVPTQGNMLICFAAIYGGYSGASAGWSVVASQPALGTGSSGSAAAGVGPAILYKVAGAAEAATQSPVPGVSSGVVYEVTNLSQSDLLGSLNFSLPAPAGGTTGASVTLTAVQANSLIVGAGVADVQTSISVMGASGDASNAGYQSDFYSHQGDQYSYAGFHKSIISQTDVTITTSRAGAADDWLAVVTLAPRYTGGSGGSGGGGGASTLAELTDVDENTAPLGGQVLTYDDTAAKWHPATPVGGGGGGGVLASTMRLTLPPGYGYYSYSVGEIELLDSLGVKIPLPTGSTFSASSIGASDGSTAASNAFDGNPATYWGSANAAYPMNTTEWIEVDMPSPVRVFGIAITARAGSAQTGQQAGQVGNFTLVNASGASVVVNYGALAPVPVFGDGERRVFTLPIGGA